MNMLQRRFEHWASINRWSGLLPLEKDELGGYAYPVTIIAYEAWVASQADVIDMITKQDYADELEAA